MSSLLADLRGALRSFRASPLVAGLTIATLAVGLGAATAIFSIVDGVLLRPLPVRDQNHLLTVWTRLPERGFDHWPLSYDAYLRFRERARSTITDVAAHPYSGTLPTVLLLQDGSAMPLQRTAVSGNWFDVLGVTPAAGRLLTDDDDRVGAPAVVVLSSSLATRLFGSAPAALGQRLRLLDETSSTVVGVAPAGFEYPRAAEAWMPSVVVKDSPYVAWDLLVRTAPDLSAAQAREELTAILLTLQKETGPLGDVATRQVIRAEPIVEEIVGSVRPALRVVVGGVLLTFLLAGINVASILLVRVFGQGRELAIRMAIGATPARLARQLTTECAVLGVAGCAGAMVVAIAGVAFFRVVAPSDWPRLDGIAVTHRALGFLAASTVGAVLFFCVLPTVHAAWARAANALRATDSHADQRPWRHVVRHSLVVAQVALAVLVLSTAGLLFESLERLRRLDLGVRSEDVVLAEIALPPGRYPEPAALQQAMVRLAEQMRTVATVTSATVLSMAPFAGTEGVDATVFAEGQALDDAANPIVNYEGVDPWYATTLGATLLKGRALDARDTVGSQPVVAVNETFARMFWPGLDPIGRRVKLGGRRSTGEWRTVVGVFADTRYRELANVRPTMYVAYPQGIPVSPGYLAVRSPAASAIGATIRQVLAAHEPGAVVVSLAPLRQLLARPLRRPRFHAAVVGCFAAVGVALSVVGAYGAMAFFVRQRRREIGIRLALGATPRNIRRLIVGQGMSIGCAGVVIGLACSLASREILEPLLFGSSALQPLILAATAMTVLVVIVAATAAPVRLAARIDPLLVLRRD